MHTSLPFLPSALLAKQNGFSFRRAFRLSGQELTRISPTPHPRGGSPTHLPPPPPLPPPPSLCSRLPRFVHRRFCPPRFVVEVRKLAALNAAAAAAAVAARALAPGSAACAHAVDPTNAPLAPALGAAKQVWPCVPCHGKGLGAGRSACAAVTVTHRLHPLVAPARPFPATRLMRHDPTPTASALFAAVVYLSSSQCTQALNDASLPFGFLAGLKSSGLRKWAALASQGADACAKARTVTEACEEVEAEAHAALTRRANRAGTASSAPICEANDAAALRTHAARAASAFEALSGGPSWPLALALGGLGDLVSAARLVVNAVTAPPPQEPALAPAETGAEEVE